jgi:hypothetical protein
MDNLLVFCGEESEPIKTKPCICCGVEKSLNEYSYKLDHHDKRSNTCKVCTNIQSKHRNYLKKTVRPKPNICECCGKSILEESRNRKPKPLYLDHDHKTGEFRGWICHDCNTALARAGDNLEGVMNLVRYLEKK